MFVRLKLHILYFLNILIILNAQRLITNKFSLVVDFFIIS